MGCFLGISAYYHDSAAAIVRDGEIVAAAQQERFSRLKHDSRFPTDAISYCLGEAFVEPSDLDGIIFHDDPVLHMDRFFTNALEMAPRGRDIFIAGCHAQLGEKARLAQDVEAALGEVPKLLTCGHHLSHAASAFFPSPYEEAAILTLDGVGEWASCTVGRGGPGGIEIIEEIRYPHSIGMLYSAFTQFCGFKVNSGEYKLMGLAPYGTPRFADIILSELVDVRDDGSIRLDTDAFGFLDSRRMIGDRFEALFGGPARQSSDRFTRREMDLAASVQFVAEDIIMKMARHALKTAGSRNLVMAGGVALNCVANGRVQRELALDGIFVQPAADDSGGALGSALYAAHQLAGDPRQSIGHGDAMKGSRLGPNFSGYEIDSVLSRFDAPAHPMTNAQERAKVVAKALAEGQVVGYFSGRMEYGPRALGGRSILGDPRRQDMQRRMNIKIKNRESFRPFAPIVLAEHASDYFELDVESPYMLLVAPVRKERRLPMEVAPDASDDALLIVDQPRSDIPAVTHVDYSARVQTVDKDRAPDLRSVLEGFYAETGCPVLVNTSFNVRGEPIVCTPFDAYRCFMMTDMDMLVLEDRILLKAEQPPFAETRNDDEDPEAEPVDRSDTEIAAREIDPNSTVGMAAALFDDFITPLAEARRREGRPPLFPHGPDPSAATYYQAPLKHSMGADLAYPGGATRDGLVDALERFWDEKGEIEMAAMAPRLKVFAEAHEAAQQRSDGSVDIFVYTMF